MPVSASQAFVSSLGLPANATGNFAPAISSRRLYQVQQSRPRARITPVSRVKDPVALEEKLLSCIEALREKGGYAVHQYRTKYPDEYEEAITAMEALEKTSTGFGASTRKLKTLLVGSWRLVLTNSAAVEKNSGSITGLGNLPLAKCLCVNVILAKDGSARTVEKVKVFGGIMDGENTLEGKWKVEKDTLDVTYAQANLMNIMKLRADSKAVLRNSYCSANVRVGRSKGGDFYTFVKE